MLTSNWTTTDTVILVENTNGFRAGQVVSIGGTNKTIATIDSETQFTVTSQLGASKSSGDAVYETDGIVAPTAEGGMKPGVELTFELDEVVPRVIAAHTFASRQVLSDAAQLWQHVDQRLTYAVRLSEEWQLLYGTGSGEDLRGLLTDANRQQHNIGSDSKLDALRKAATKASLAGYPATGIVMYPTDREEIDLAKSATGGHYLLQSSANAAGLPSYWRLPIVESITIGAGRAAVGAFALACTLYDREAANVRLAE